MPPERVSRGPCRKAGTYKFDDLTTGDILDKVYGLRRGILDLTKDKHLKPRPHVRDHFVGSWFPKGLTIWDISWVYLYSLGKAISSKASPPRMRVRVVGWPGAVWRCDRSNSVWDRSHACSVSRACETERPSVRLGISPSVVQGCR